MTVSYISTAHGVSINHLRIVVNKLVQLGYIESVRDRGGGIKLCVEPESVRLGKIVRKTENDFF